MRAVAYEYERPRVPSRILRASLSIMAFLGRLFLMGLPVPHRALPLSRLRRRLSLRRRLRLVAILHKCLCSCLGRGQILHSSSLQLSFCPWLEAIQEIKELVLLRHVSDVKHQRRELLDIKMHRSGLFESFKTLPRKVLNVLGQELSLKLSLEIFPSVDRATPTLDVLIPRAPP